MVLRRTNTGFWTAALVVGLVVAYFVHLGFVQIDLIAQEHGLAAAQAAQQNVNASKISLMDAVDDPANDLRRGYLRGVWKQNANIKIGPRVHSGMSGYWIATPFMLANQKITILAIRGWVPETMAPVMLSAQAPFGMATLTGALRAGESVSETPVAGDQQSWRKLDIDAIAAANGVEYPARLVFFMETSSLSEDPALRRVQPLEGMDVPHRQYAFFWFGAAAVLAALFYALAVHPRFFNLPKAR
ncbi:MAG: SURF1 family protein [Rhodospirillales bacterium]|nr:SURF1 family protein [Alphaproteobacteria bacterium]MCB9986790.1 SURF1 family protein [Rhodospirillales bacterium]USO08442.1 MAG: SURF1 family protein [Rhodospirillales bacterium]